MLWLYLHFPSLLLDSLSAAEPSVPMALAEPRQHQLVAVNAIAAQAGVTSGQSVATAVLLCPRLQLYPPDESRQQQLLQQLCNLLYQYTGDIALQPPDGLCIRAGSMLQLYSGFAAYWQQLQQLLQAQQCRVIAACASTPISARLLARSGRQCLTLDPEQRLKVLQQTDLSYSDLSTEVQQQLARLGIRKIGQLQALAPAELARRFPQEVVGYLQQLAGDSPKPLPFYRPASQFQHYLLLQYEISQTDILLRPLSPLLKQLQQFLLKRNQLCRCLVLTLYFRQQASRQIQVQAMGGEVQAARWQSLLSLQLEQVKLPEPVYALELQALQLSAAVAHSGTLLDYYHGNDGYCAEQPCIEKSNTASNSAVSKAQLLSLLAAKLGQQVLQSPAYVSSHWPEQSLQRQAPLPEKEHNSTAASLMADKPYAIRPSLQLAEPVNLTEPIQLLSAPERLESLCWQSGVLRQRDYYVARNRQGQQLWVFKTPAQQWFIHGWFS